MFRSREDLDVIVDYHPHYEEFKPKILKEVGNHELLTYDTNLKAKRTGWDTQSPCIEQINELVCLLIVGRPKWSWMKNLAADFTENWFARYNKGDYAIPHDHMPFTFSYVFFINSPKGSSPLVFTNSGKEVEPDEGKLVVFPSVLGHHVPKNNCDNRIILAGNCYVREVR